MDPAGPPSPQNQFERIENVLMQHQQRMEEADGYARRAAEANAFAALSAQLQQLMSTVHRMISEPRVGTPERYDGNPELCGSFQTFLLLTL